MGRLIKVAVGGFALVVVLAGPAGAYECYNASRSDNGNAKVAEHSQALWDAERLLTEFDGLCPEGVDHVITGMQELGYKTDFTINVHALMAGGLERGTPNPNAETLVHNGKGIDHLGEQFFVDSEPLIAEAIAKCEED